MLAASLPLSLLLLVSSAARASSSRAATAETIETLLKERGSAVEGTFKVSVPQQELDVRLDGFRLTPAMGLASWIAFTPADGEAAASGDLVLLEDEAAAAQKEALAAGFEVTGLRDYFLREKPKVVFMSILGRGKMEALQDGVKRIFDGIRVLRQAKRLQAVASVLPYGLDTPGLERRLGVKGRVVDGVFEARGLEESEIALQGTMEKAAACGGVAAMRKELSAVVEALVARGLEVPSISEVPGSRRPESLLVRFWGVGRAEDLAAAFRAANAAAAGSSAVPPR